MSNIYSLIAFLSFFAVCLLTLDYTLPRKFEYVHQITSLDGEVHYYSKTEQLPDRRIIKANQLVLKQYTPLLKVDISYTLHNTFSIKESIKTSPIYIPGFAFILFLAIGAVFGLFFKKPEYLERRAAYYNLIIGGILFLLYFLS